MNYKVIEKNNIKIAIIEDDVLITDEQTAIDTFMTISYEAEADRFIISEKNLKEEFFELRNKIAGNIFQKIINYRMKLAIVGDFDKYESKSLKAFIYECNRGKDIFFTESIDEAVTMLSKE